MTIPIDEKRTRALMSDMAKKGVLPEGEYLLQGSW